MSYRPYNRSYSRHCTNSLLFLAHCGYNEIAQFANKYKLELTRV